MMFEPWRLKTIELIATTFLGLSIKINKVNYKFINKPINNVRPAHEYQAVQSVPYGWEWNLHSGLLWALHIFWFDC